MGVKAKLDRIPRKLTDYLAGLEPEKQLRAYLAGLASDNQDAAQKIYQAAPRVECLVKWPLESQLDGLMIVKLSSVSDILAAGLALSIRVSDTMRPDETRDLDFDRLIMLSDMTLAPWRALCQFLVDDIGVDASAIEALIPHPEAVRLALSTAEFARKLFFSWLDYLTGIAELSDAESAQRLKEHRQKIDERLEVIVQNQLAGIRELWQFYKN